MNAITAVLLDLAAIGEMPAATPTIAASRERMQIAALELALSRRQLQADDPIGAARFEAWLLVLFFGVSGGRA